MKVAAFFHMSAEQILQIKVLAPALNNSTISIITEGGPLPIVF